MNRNIDRTLKTRPSTNVLYNSFPLEISVFRHPFPSISILQTSRCVLPSKNRSVEKQISGDCSYLNRLRIVYDKVELHGGADRFCAQAV